MVPKSTPLVATDTETVPAAEPAASAGTVHRSCVGLTYSTAAASTSPNLQRRPALSVKPAPVSDTTVPPLTEPPLGVTVDTATGGMYLNSDAAPAAAL